MNINELKVLIDMPYNASLAEKLKHLPEITLKWIENPKEQSRYLPPEYIKDCDIIFCTFLPENFEQMLNLKMIQICSTGYQQLQGKKLVERHIRASNARGVFDIPIAEWNMAMMINLVRDVRGLIRNQDAHIWDRSVRFQQEIRGMVVGIWGYGGIGRETARLAKALGMEVHVLTRRPISKRNNIYCVPGSGDPEGILPDRLFLLDEKENFLHGLDFLIMAIPQTSDTEGIIGIEELRMLKPGAFVLNPARGPLIKEEALLFALESGVIAGAAIDTHYYYPMPKGHPLWSMPNVIMTPHISGSSGGRMFLERIYDIFAENVTRFISGGPLLNELTPTQLTDA